MQRPYPGRSPARSIRFRIHLARSRFRDNTTTFAPGLRTQSGDQDHHRQRRPRGAVDRDFPGGFRLFRNRRRCRRGHPDPVWSALNWLRPPVARSWQSRADTEAISDEIVRLNPSIVYIVGDSLPLLPGGTEARSLSIEEALAETSLLLGGARCSRPAVPPAWPGRRRGSNGSAGLTGAFEANVTVDAELGGLLCADNRHGVARRRQPARSRGSGACQRPGPETRRSSSSIQLDLRTPHETVASLRAIKPNQTVVAGNFDPGLLEWQLPALLSAPELPGGGLVFYPGRRLVALYGNPTTGALGSPRGTVGRRIGPEGCGDRRGIRRRRGPVLPSFEIIATVASASAGVRQRLLRRNEPRHLAAVDRCRRAKMGST